MCLCIAVNLRSSQYDVYIGRAGKGKNGYWGNPFLLGKDGNREEVLETYRAWFNKRVIADLQFKLKLEQLKGKRLGCFCSPQLCHGDVIAEYLNAL